MSVDRTAVLIMDADVNYVLLIRQVFTNAGYSVIIASDAPTAFANCSQNSVALALIDISTPRWDGMKICLTLQNVAKIPVIALAQAETTAQQIEFLAEKAEEHIMKPFTPSELLLRARPFLHRYCNKRQPQNSTTAGDLVLDHVNNSLLVCCHFSTLTPNECRLLNYFMQHPNQTISKTELILTVWQNHFYNEENALRVLVRRLRKKIEKDVSHPIRLQTVQGIGYRLNLINRLSDNTMQALPPFHPALHTAQQNLQNASSPVADAPAHQPNTPP